MVTESYAEVYKTLFTAYGWIQYAIMLQLRGYFDGKHEENHQGKVAAPSYMWELF